MGCRGAHRGPVWRRPVDRHSHTFALMSRPVFQLLTATILAWLASAHPAAAQRTAADSMVSAPVSSLRYEVRADRAALAARRLRVTTTFDVAGEAPVVLSL